MKSIFTEKYNKNIDLIAYAPGRVNIIGEHTDYNDGFVLPMAIDMGTTVAISKRNDKTINVYAKTIDESLTFELNDIPATNIGSWNAYVVGVFASISKITDNDNLCGADVVIDSNLPMGAGLSSSASLDVCLIYAYAKLCNIDISKERIAILAQQVEHEYAGTNCGIMDQMIIACAQNENALLLDCKTLKQQNIPLKMGNMSFVICDTKVKHSLASSAYNTRREECESACEIMGVKSLRDINLSELSKFINIMPSNIYNRAKHVVTENIRTQNVARWMPEQKWADIGIQMYQSHKSLQHDYLVSCDESDFIVDCCQDIEGVYGARMTGGGFGGCVIALVSDEHLYDFKQTLSSRYLQKFGKNPEFYISKAVCGVQIK